ncbi:hypothetical protein ACFVH6_41390 [Spirillospora sp. NPDC127200]
MAIHIRLNGPAADDDLHSLYDWFQADPAIRQRARMSLESAPTAPGEMGTTLDVIQLLVSSGFSATGLFVSIRTWLDTRSAKPDIVIEHNGIKISLADATPEQIKEITDALDDDQP